MENNHEDKDKLELDNKEYIGTSETLGRISSTDGEDRSKKVFVPEEAPKVDPRMIVRTLVFIVAIINAVSANIFGHALDLTINQELAYQIISGIFLVGSGVVTWFKDNDVTKKARKRKEIIRQVEED